MELNRDAMLFPEARAPSSSPAGKILSACTAAEISFPPRAWATSRCNARRMVEAQDYMREWDDYNAKVKNGDKDASPPKRDLKMEALADVLRGKFAGADPLLPRRRILTEMAMAKEFGYKVRAFHHALEAYKVADQLAANNVAIATFSDWWGYKQEAWDAIPWNAVMSMRKGVRVAIKSDSEDFTRRLNQEAAKTIRYGGASDEEALKMITLNPAWIIGVDDKRRIHRSGQRRGPGDLGRISALQHGVPNKVFIDGEFTLTVRYPVSASRTTRRANNVTARTFPSRMQPSKALSS